MALFLVLWALPRSLWMMGAMGMGLAGYVAARLTRPAFCGCYANQCVVLDFSLIWVLLPSAVVDVLSG